MENINGMSLWWLFLWIPLGFLAGTIVLALISAIYAMANWIFIKSIWMLVRIVDLVIGANDKDIRWN